MTFRKSVHTSVTKKQLEIKIERAHSIGVLPFKIRMTGEMCILREYSGTFTADLQDRALDNAEMLVLGK